MEYKLFENHCRWCGKSIPSYATDRQGHVKDVFCGGPCQTSYAGSKKMVENTLVTRLKKGITQEELTKRMAKKGWDNREYLVEEISV